MQIRFRQGVIDYQESPYFLHKVGDNVFIKANEDNTVVAFVYKDVDFLYAETEDILAWTGPFTTKTWLYWDIDLDSGTRTFGQTTVEPDFGFVLPKTADNDQHFFDLSRKIMKVYGSSCGWEDRARVFAGVVNTDGSIDPYNVTSSQVGLNKKADAGFLLYGLDGNLIKDNNDIPLNTEYTMTSQESIYNQTSLGARVEYVKTKRTLPKYRCVSWESFGNIVETTEPSNERRCNALTLQIGYADERTRVLTQGYVTDLLDFNWTDPPNTSLYVGYGGVLTTTPPTRDSIQRVGYVVDRRTIYFDPGHIILIDPPDIVDISPTPSTSMTPTPSQSATFVPTPTPTPTPSVTPTISLTPSITPTPSTTATMTPTPSPTSTATATPTPTPSTSLSMTPTPSVTSSITPTPSVTPSISLSASNTPTPTPTPSTTATATPTPTPSTSVSASPTPTPTPTPSSVAEDLFSFTLTYDEQDDDGISTLVSSKTSPLISSSGFLGDGLGRALRVDSGDLPSWINVTTLGIQADYRIENYRNAQDTVLDFSVGKFVVQEDIRNIEIPVAGVEVSGQFTPLFRKDWIFQQTVDSVEDVVVNATHVITLSTDNIGSEIRRFNKSDYTLDASFTTPSRFLTIESDPTGEDFLWGVTDDKKLVKIDAATSYIHDYKEDVRYDLSAISQPVSATWLLDGSSNILAVGEYSGLSPCRVWLLDESQITNGGTFSFGDEINWYNLPVARLRDISGQNLNVYISYSGSSFFGRFSAFDLDGVIGVEPSGSTINLTAELDSPSPYSNGITYDSLGDVWVTSGGYIAENEPQFWNAIWKYDPGGFNTVTVNVDRINNETSIFNQFVEVDTISGVLGPIDNISIGADWNGASFSNYSSSDVKNIAFKNRIIDSTEYQSIRSGSFEPNVLTEYDITVSNPTGASGVSDWSNSLGTLQSSGEYFSGGSAGTTQSFQTIDLTGAGIGIPESDGSVWIVVTWEQSGDVNTPTSKAEIGIEQPSGTQFAGLVNIEPLFSPVGKKWRRRVFSVLLDSGETEVDVIMRFTGTNSYIRNINVIGYKP